MYVTTTMYTILQLYTLLLLHILTRRSAPLNFYAIINEPKTRRALFTDSILQHTSARARGASKNLTGESMNW